MSKKLGVVIAGLNGAVASTVVSGVELIRRGLREPIALLSEDPEIRRRVELTPLDELVFAGWDPRGESVLQAVHRNAVLDPRDVSPITRKLQSLTPWPGRTTVAAARRDLASFKRKQKLDRIIVVNLLPTEPVGQTGPSALYARAAIESGCPYINFTPNRADESPALRELALERGVPLAGKDGKTGQTMMKSVLAPAFRMRNLRVAGWFSTNLLGNEDGRTLRDPAAHKAKEICKSDLLNEMLGYKVPTHIVQINYYPLRGDNKEAWDNIDLVGFLGKPMMLKVNFLCRDSILAAPFVIDLIRFLDLAARRGERGPQEWLSFFFKAPYAANGRPVENGLAAQYRQLIAYLDDIQAVSKSR